MSTIQHNFDINIDMSMLDKYNIKLETVINNKYVFNINGYYIIFTYNQDRNYYIISSDINLPFFDIINIQSIQKKQTLDVLIEKVYTQLTKKTKLKIKEVDEKMIIEEERQRLNSLLKQSKSIININGKNITKTFTEITIQDLIINEYLKLYQKKDKNYSINVTDNIYVWEVKFNNVEMELMFHNNYYPNYPIQINIKKPLFENSLNNRIANSKLFQLEYSDPLTSIDFIINRVIEIIKKYGIVSNETNCSIIPELKIILDNLNHYINNLDDQIDQDYEYIKIINIGNITNSGNSDKINKKPNKKVTNDKFNGTGYTGSNTSKWSIKEYEEILNNKRIQLENIINKIYGYLSINNFDEKVLENTINQSLLIKFLKTELRTSILEMNNKIELYKMYFNIIEYLLNQNFNLECLIEQFKILYDEAKTTIKFDKSNELANRIILINTLIISQIQQPIKQSSNQDIKDINELYINTLSDLKFTQIDLINTGLCKPDYKTLAISSQPTSGCLKRISTELPSLISNLPIDINASIFLIIDENNPRIMRSMITGPPNTPYDSCCYIFDIYLPSNYPIEGPKVNFWNTNGQRINPNLYACGKVCLSILGTYVGPSASQTERWNTQSTLYQVLISIQSQILVDEPYFNEPGYQIQYKTAVGDIASKKYNDTIVGYTMQMMSMLIDNPNKYNCFSEQIKNHFKIKKEKIIEVVNKFTQTYPKYESLKLEIINKLNKL
jgi:ubiquitin-protein ligase